MNTYVNVCACSFFVNTMNLGYNDHGYNEFTFITKTFLFNFWSQITRSNVNIHGYNESRTVITNFSAGPGEFDISEFD